MLKIKEIIDKKPKIFALFGALILCLFLIFAYLIITDLIESHLYPKGDVFYFVPWVYSDNESCVDVSSYPSSVFYYNDPQFIYPNKNSAPKNCLVYYLTLVSKCNFTNADIMLSGTDIYSTIEYKISKDGSNSSTDFSNINDNNIYKISIPYDSNIRIYSLQIFIPINNSFYSTYMFNQGAYGNLKYTELGFIFKTDWAKGYYADENAFSIRGGDYSRDSPVFRGNYKHYDFNNTSSITMKFSPKNKFLSLIQKMLDAILLGVISVIIYDSFKKGKNKII